MNPVFPTAIGRLSSYKEIVPFKQLKALPEVLFITSYPPRECGLATYSQDLRNAVAEKFGHSISPQICALESGSAMRNYPAEVKYILETQKEEQYAALATKINKDDNIAMIFLQHEFGLFGGKYGDYLLKLLSGLNKPVSITFHTILPNPNDELKATVIQLSNYAANIVVMTNNAVSILRNDYGIDQSKIVIIPHGTHLILPRIKKHMIVPRAEKHKIQDDRIILTTFGLLNQGKSIETAVEALPQIIARFPNLLYLIIGKTHPEVIKKEGEKYRDSLRNRVEELQLQNNVRFIDKYASLEELLEYLERTDIYLFTSKDPNQAVSGTLVYAMACGCPLISTPIPHAKEMLKGCGKSFDFQNSDELARAAIELLSNPGLLKEMRLNALHKIYPTSWQNSAIAYMELAEKELEKRKVTLKYKLPKLSLDHIKRLTTEKGMIQFSVTAVPDINSGYTLDDNARALIAIVKHYELTRDDADLGLIKIYLDFIRYCQQEDGSFLNYVDYENNFLPQNDTVNLEDSNGRAIWALGQFISGSSFLPKYLVDKAAAILGKVLPRIQKIKSPRAIGFAIKGLYFYNLEKNKAGITDLITSLAENLASKYRAVSAKDWKWYEDYLTYANSILPEAMLLASVSTGSELFRQIAKTTFDFLLSIIFKNGRIKVVSNRGWHLKGVPPHNFGEQPVDVAGTILTLNAFYEVFGSEEYRIKMETAFDWFLGKNHLHQIVYNPKTGGCHDGVEEDHINLNQGAESTLSYLLARLVFEKPNFKRVNPSL